MVISMIKTSVTQVGFNRQPVTPGIIHHNKVLLWGSDQQGGVILGVHVVRQNDLHICLDFGMRLGVF